MTVFLIQTLIFLKLHNSEIKKQIGIKKFARPINGILINENNWNISNNNPILYSIFILNIDKASPTHSTEAI